MKRKKAKALSRNELVEAMAESAHEAWLSSYVKLGYKSRKAEWGEEFMVPFDKLSERGKEFDRVIMRAILDCFERQGFDVVPRAEGKADARSA
jgi:hypothetical protein